MSRSSFVITLPELIRIRATGSDRTKFLHNFCTNDISGTAAGRWREAFFTNVKARILAHGFVMASEDEHEIWMLPGDERMLLSHLNRYIITEDVVFESVTAGSAAIAVVGNTPVSVSDGMPPESGQWADVVVDDAHVRCLQSDWAGQPVALISGPRQNIRTLYSRVVETVPPGELADLERLRILERFPLIGRDLSDDHLAPEAGRNRSAICYTKGCYLGQEPIARIDAMGQVNRILAAVEIQVAVEDSESAYELSSFDDTESPAVGLAVIRTSSVSPSPMVVRTSDGRSFSAIVPQPEGVNGAGNR